MSNLVLSGKFIEATPFFTSILKSSSEGYSILKRALIFSSTFLIVDFTVYLNVSSFPASPGLISTPFNQKYAEDPTHGEKWGKETIVGRWGMPSDIVGAAVFLSSNESDFINGSEMKIDGGWLAAKTREGEL